MLIVDRYFIRDDDQLKNCKMCDCRSWQLFYRTSSILVFYFTTTKSLFCSFSLFQSLPFYYNCGGYWVQILQFPLLTLSLIFLHYLYILKLFHLRLTCTFPICVIIHFFSNIQLRRPGLVCITRDNKFCCVTLVSFLRDSIV